MSKIGGLYMDELEKSYATINELREALVTIKTHLGSMANDSKSAAVKEANANQAWHIADIALGRTAP